MTAAAPTIAECQQLLITAGYDVGPDGADGKFGPASKAAVMHFQMDHGLPMSGALDQATTTELFYPKKEAPQMGNWLSTFVTTTAFKYLVTMAATYIATRLGLDHGSVEGILTQLVAVVMGIWGMWESSRNKIVLDGAKVSVSALPAADKAAVSNIVAANS